MRATFLLIILVLFTWPAAAATLTVGPDQPFKTLASAVQASSPGDTLVLTVGDYVDDFAVIHHPLTIRSTGGKARLRATGLIPNGKAILIANADLTIEDLIFEGAKVSHNNGAGIRYQKGTLKIESCIFRNNENGILGSDNPAGLISISGSLFQDNGYGDGYTHGIYIGKISELTIYRTGFVGTHTGHHLKSRAATTLVHNNYFADDRHGSSYAIDLPNGGTAAVESNYFIQKENTKNPVIISYGTRKLHPVGSVSLKHNVFINQANKGTAFRNKSKKDAVFERNQLIGSLRKTRGRVEERDNAEFQDYKRKILTYEEWKNSLPDE